MLGGFVLIFSLGHTYCVVLVLLILVMLFRELLNLKRDSEREKPIRSFFLINWYFFIVTLCFLFPRFLPGETQITLFSEPNLQLMHSYSPLTIFILFVTGILMFTLSLEKLMYRYQFKQLAWTFITLIFVVS
jgi:phosphatidate cytidylyltransferase